MLKPGAGLEYVYLIVFQESNPLQAESGLNHLLSRILRKASVDARAGSKHHLARNNSFDAKAESTHYHFLLLNLLIVKLFGCS